MPGKPGMKRRKKHELYPKTRNKFKVCASCGKKFPIASFRLMWKTADHLAGDCMDCEADPPLTVRTKTEGHDDD